MSTSFPIVADPRYRLLTASSNQAVFAITFGFLDAGDVTAYKIGLGGDSTLLTRPTNYSLSGAGNPSGGTLTLKTGARADEKLLIVGTASRARASSVVKDGKFSSAAQDAAIDRLTLIAQELDRELGRALKVDYGATPPGLAIGGAGTIPVWDADGNLVEGPDAAALAAIEAALGVEAGRALVYPAAPADPVYDAGSRRIGNLADGLASADAATKGQLDTLEADFGLDGIAATLAALQAQIDVLSAGHPVHLIFDTVAPDGWLKLNGQTIGDASSGGTARANADTAGLYAHLWAKFANTLLPIQTSAGAASIRGADAATDYAAHKRLPLPEVRGEFFRALDDGRGVDPGRVLGSAQGEAFKSHTHTFEGDPLPAHAHTMRTWDNSGQAGGDTISNNNDNRNRTVSTAAVSAGTPAGTNTAAGGTETRPRNIALLAIIKI